MAKSRPPSLPAPVLARHPSPEHQALWAQLGEQLHALAVGIATHATRRSRYALISNAAQRLGWSLREPEDYSWEPVALRGLRDAVVALLKSGATTRQALGPIATNLANLGYPLPPFEHPRQPRPKRPSRRVTTQWMISLVVDDAYPKPLPPLERVRDPLLRLGAGTHLTSLEEAARTIGLRPSSVLQLMRREHAGTPERPFQRCRSEFIISLWEELV